MGEIESCSLGLHLAEIKFHLFKGQNDESVNPCSELIDVTESIDFDGCGLFLSRINDGAIIRKRLEKGIHDFSSKRGSHPLRFTDSKMIQPSIYSAMIGLGHQEPQMVISSPLPTSDHRNPSLEFSPEFSLDIEFFNKTLGDDQQKAVRLAVFQFGQLQNSIRPIVSIEGPPGTGKTEVAIEIVRQFKKIANTERERFRTIIQIYFPTNAGASKFRERLAQYGKVTYIRLKLND